MAKKVKTEKEEIESLFTEIGELKKSENFANLLHFVEKFNNYSTFNAFLLHLQKPGSQYVATACRWKSKFNRTVKPGARPLVILKPHGPIQLVFELGDTEGDPVPEEILHPFKTEGQKIKEETFETLLFNLERNGIRFTLADQGSQSGGSIQVSKSTGYQKAHYRDSKTKMVMTEGLVKIKYDLVVNRNLTDEEKFSTIVHELGHLFCGHIGTYNKKYFPDRRKISKESEEFEAETISWVVCRRMGIDSPSARYLSGYLENNETIPSVDLDLILKVSSRIDSMTTFCMKIPDDLKMTKE